MKFLKIILFLISINDKLIACNCVGDQTVDSKIRSADVVISGKVLSFEKFQILSDSLPNGDTIFKMKCRILLNKIYKSPINLDDTITIITGIGNGDCGFPFENFNKYIIYGKFMNRYFLSGEMVQRYIYTSVCSGTLPFKYKEQKNIKRYMRKRTT